jgi:hypothetical protein
MPDDQIDQTSEPNKRNMAFVRRGLLQSPEIVGVGNHPLLPQRGHGSPGSSGKCFTSLLWLQLCLIVCNNMCRNGWVQKGASGAKTRFFCQVSRIFIWVWFSEIFHSKLPLAYG